MLFNRGSLLLNTVLLSLAISMTAKADPDAVRQKELLYLLRHDCGSCHGMTLRGGIGLPLTPEAIAGKPDALIYETIMQGRAGTPMPPWGEILDSEDTLWLVSVLRRGIPADE